PIHEKYDPTSPLGRVLALLLPSNPPGDGIASQLGYAADATLGLPRRLLLAGPGAALNAMGASENTGADAVTDVIQRNLNDPVMGTMLGVSPVGKALQLVGQYGSPSMQRVGIEALTDPLTLIGGPGKAIGKGVGETLLARSAARAGVQT